MSLVPMKRSDNREETIKVSKFELSEIVHSGSTSASNRSWTLI
jgi:hypothetical protein